MTWKIRQKSNFRPKHFISTSFDGSRRLLRLRSRQV